MTHVPRNQHSRLGRGGHVHINNSTFPSAAPFAPVDQSNLFSVNCSILGFETASSFSKSSTYPILMMVFLGNPKETRNMKLPQMVQKLDVIVWPLAVVSFFSILRGGSTTIGVLADQLIRGPIFRGRIVKES